MRIIAGEFKGRQIERPKTRSVRPISGLVLEALFGKLGDISGLSLLDAYAGSGLIGFEALSRGAVKVDAVEMQPDVAELIRRNAKSLGAADRHHIFVSSVENWLKYADRQYDLIIAGPPFALINNEVLDGLADHLQQSGIFVAWHSSRISPPKLKSVKLVDSRKYGDSSLSFYKP